MISIGRKLFEEVDMPLESKIVSEDPINKIAEKVPGRLRSMEYIHSQVEKPQVMDLP